MTPHYTDDAVTLYHGDALDVLRTLPDASVDAVVTDPPAGISFMGRSWDDHRGGREQWSAWLAEVMRECYRVAKPGAHALVWALPRTSHWTACGIEDAGWIIRDRVAHIFASGFPKSRDVSKDIDRMAGAEREVIGTGRWNHVKGTAGRDGGLTPDGYVSHGGIQHDLTAPATDDARRWAGWGTALKPATEDWWLARKPLAGTVAQTVLAYGTGALNVDGCRVAAPDAPDSPVMAPNAGARYVGVLNGGTTSAPEPRATSATSAGRWPSNLILSHADCVDGCVPGCPVAELDRQSGNIHGAGAARSAIRAADPTGMFALSGDGQRYGDSGGGSRFFPVFKYEPKAPTSERPKVDGVAHETVKPLDLLRWLARLVCPPHGVILDPFVGSGTTAEACVIEGFRCIAVERDARYLPLIVARLTKPIPLALDFGGDHA
jgi:hypothetical protein